jgi:transposase
MRDDIVGGYCEEFLGGVEEQILEGSVEVQLVQALRRGMSKSQAARAFCVSLSSVKRYAKMAEQGRSLVPKKRPGSKPATGQSARKLLEADLQERPGATLAETGASSWRGCLCGVRVSDSTVCRLLKRMGFTRKKGLWVRASATSS